jgi:iron(III) transport system permease protein
MFANKGLDENNTEGIIQRKLPGIIISSILFVLIICPLIAVFIKAVMINDRFDMTKAIAYISDRGNFRPVLNSVWLGFWVIIVSTIIAAPVAFIMTRTEFSRHRWINTVLMIPFMTPPYISSMGWILFMQKRGLLEQLLPFTKNLNARFFSFAGLVLVMSFHVFPFLYEILKNAMLNIGSSMDEAGEISGGNFFYRTRRIFLPLLSGNFAIGALLVFVKTLSEYGTPATFGKRIGFDVFTTEIHRHSTMSPIDFGKSASLSVILIGICIFMWYIQNYITNKRAYNLVSGKGVKVLQKKLNLTGKFFCRTYFCILFLIAIGIPYFSVIVTSLIKLRGNGLESGNFTFTHYVNLFTANPKGVSAMFTSLTLAAISASIAAVLGTITAVVIGNSGKIIKRLLEATGLLPEMLPGIVIIIGLMIFWNGIYKIVPVYNTLMMMVLTYVVLFLPYTIQYVSSSFSQISAALIEAGKTFGGNQFYILRRITIPLVLKGVVSGWTMTFIISFRELVAASMLAPPSVLTISTFIVREFEQGSVSIGMAMAVLCVLMTTGILLALNVLIRKSR